MRLIPQEEEFFDLFEELANKIDEGVELFLDMVEYYQYPDPKIGRLKELENETDIITHRTYDKLHRTFLTSIDREDIYNLPIKWTAFWTWSKLLQHGCPCIRLK